MVFRKEHLYERIWGNDSYGDMTTIAVHIKKIRDKIEMILTEKGQEAQIEIKDNGIGVSEDVLDKIFERFYKEDKARSNSSPGTGLGLYIARKIILDHGGSIQAKSRVGLGTSIFFTLPIVK